MDGEDPLPFRRTPWHMAQCLQNGRVNPGYLHDSCVRSSFFSNPMDAVARLGRKRGNAIGSGEPDKANSGSNEERIFQSFWFRITGNESSETPMGSTRFWHWEQIFTGDREQESI